MKSAKSDKSVHVISDAQQCVVTNDLCPSKYRRTLNFGHP